MLNNWAHDIARWRREQQSTIMKRDDYMLASLMMVVTEIAEAAEDVRHERWDHLPEELADAMIRLLGICGRMDINIEKAIREKMEKNTA